MPTAPLGHVNRRLDGSYLGRSQGGEMARMPDSPSTITSRASAGFRATNAMRLAPPNTRFRVHSDPVLVLPAPRPPRLSHTSQSPGGSTWDGLAQNLSQSQSALSACSGVSVARMAVRSEAGSNASDSASDLRDIVPILHLERFTRWRRNSLYYLSIQALKNMNHGGHVARHGRFVEGLDD